MLRFTLWCCAVVIAVGCDRGGAPRDAGTSTAQVSSALGAPAQCIAACTNRMEGCLNFLGCELPANGAVRCGVGAALRAMSDERTSAHQIMSQANGCVQQRDVCRSTC